MPFQNGLNVRAKPEQRRLDARSRDFNFLRVKQIVRVFQLMSSASRQAPSDCAAPVSHNNS
jgi:hypothetical protein